MPNSLTRRAGLTLGPLFLETLVKHYFARVVSDSSKTGVPLRKEELLYDEAFNIVKAFLDASTRHTIEELQSFSNVRTPSPPWVRTVRLVIPMSSCDQAAVHLIEAFGGEEAMKKVVGGTKWWQVRGIRGLDAEWISTKKDWKDVKKRAKQPSRPIPTHASSEKAELPPLPESEGEGSRNQEPAPDSGDPARDSDAYQPEMDEMRCILYLHGGGYYFGSVDQERYNIQRYARKINGRILAVNYRLAPQYPFPCAIQDVLAAYLFLIRPPQGTAHRPVRPDRIVIAGDSAGGGLSLALLQVIRDSGLPAPAGGVLISPWCDFTHSFPSIFTNTDTDVLPVTGLSVHKPSPLWPPPSNDISEKVHSGLRKTITDVLHRRSKDASSHVPQAVHLMDPDNTVLKAPPTERNVGSISSLPLPGVSDADQIVSLQTTEGKTIEIVHQIQLYVPNGLLKHPLCSPALSYLGGLPPLLFIAGDREVLRDEIIYTAHRAAHPDRFPVRDETREMYPIFKHIGSDMQPTSVHLQVYDDVAHVLPILFPFSTPGKYCYRAIAQFSKHVTDTLQDSLGPTVLLPPEITSTSCPASLASSGAPNFQTLRPKSFTLGISRATINLRRLSLSLSQDAGRLSATVGDTSASTSGQVTPRSRDEPLDNAGPRVGGASETSPSEVYMAGEAKVYEGDWAGLTRQRMIRERVSTHGVIRPLEPEDELLAFQVAPELIGTLSERIIQRYVVGKERSDKKFARTIKRIEKQRLKNLDRASRDMNQHIAALQHYLDRESGAAARDGEGAGANGVTGDAPAAQPNWNMVWALDEDERPPLSSIVARRDTEEALKVARVADEAVLASERTLSANNLWNVAIGFLTASPGRRPRGRETQADCSAKASAKTQVVGRQGSRFGSLLRRNRHSEPRSSNREGSSVDE